MTDHKPPKSLGLLAAGIIISGMTIIDYYTDHYTGHHKHQNRETVEMIEWKKMELPILQYELNLPAGSGKI